jgi:hypothetical protein
MSLRALAVILALPLGVAAVEGSATGAPPLKLSYGTESLTGVGPRDPQIGLRFEYFPLVSDKFDIAGTTFKGRWDVSERYHVGVRLHDGGNDLWAWSVGVALAYEHNQFSDQPIGSVDYEGLGGGLTGSFGVHILPEHLRSQVDVSIEPFVYAGVLSQDGSFVIPQGPSVGIGEISGLRWDVAGGADAVLLVWRHVELTLGGGYLLWWVNPDEATVISPLGIFKDEVDNDNGGGFMKLGAGIRF